MEEKRLSRFEVETVVKTLSKMMLTEEMTRELAEKINFVVQAFVNYAFYKDYIQAEKCVELIKNFDGAYHLWKRYAQ